MVGNSSGDKMVCLDTSIVIEYLNGDEAIVKLLLSYLREESLSTTSVTEYELLKHRSEVKRQEAKEFLSKIKVYYLDDEASKQSSQIYRDLKAKGKEINENDILIAGIAFSKNETVLTRDEDFKHIGETSRIRVL